MTTATSPAVSLGALVRLFRDELAFDVKPGASTASVVLRGEVIATVPIPTLWPGDTLTLTFGDEPPFLLRVPRWSLRLRGRKADR